MVRKVSLKLVTHTQLRCSESGNIMINFGFGENSYFFYINTIARNVLDLTLCGLISIYVFSGCDVTTCFFNLPKLGQSLVWSKHDLITTTFVKLGWAPNATEEEGIINIEKFKFIDRVQPLTKVTKLSVLDVVVVVYLIN